MAGGGTFNQRIDELIQQVGVGSLVGKVEVDQAYAHMQHEDLTLKHTHGGQALYLTQPLLDHLDSYLETLARTTFDEKGPAEGMKDNMEHLSEQVSIKAPIRYGALRQSAHPSVTSDGAVVYDRPPVVPRLTEQQLDEEHRAQLRGY
jgi:hypothetical protein